MVVATIPGDGAFMKNSVTRGFTTAPRRVNRSISALIRAVSRYLISAVAWGASNTLLILARRSIMLFADRPTKPSNAAAVRLAQRCRGGSCGPSPGGIPLAQAGRRERVADARLRRAVALRKWDATEPRLDRVERLSALWEPISRP